MLRMSIGTKSSRHTPCAVRKNLRFYFWLRHTECAYNFQIRKYRIRVKGFFSDFSG